MWNEINGNVLRYAGAAATVTINNGGKLLQIVAHATSAGTVQFTDGTKSGTITVPIPAGTWFVYDPKHKGCVIPAGGTIVFSSTDSYLVEIEQ